MYQSAKNKVLKPPIRGLNTLSLYFCFPKGLHRLKDGVTTSRKLLRSEEVFREQSLSLSLSLSLLKNIETAKYSQLIIHNSEE